MDLTDQASEFESRPVVPQPVLKGPLADLLEWQAMAEGAYSANTLRAQKADGAIFQAFCESRGEPYLPATPKTIRAFVEDRVKAGKKPATIKRYVATISRVHIAAGLLNPCSSEAVRLGLKKMGRETSSRQDQAHPLSWKDIKEFIDGAGEGLRADRERAMLCVAYETLARRGELVALEVRDVDFHPNGTGQALIRRGKTDADGQGRAAYLSRETMRWLKVWLEHAKITEGALFRRLIGQERVDGSLNPGSIAPIFKRVAQWIGMPERVVNQVSGHSTRVGATQDLAALDIDLAAITQAGGWKSTRMPLQYAEKIDAAKSGMARAAAAAGRDEPEVSKVGAGAATFKCIYCLEQRDRLSYTKSEHVLPKSFGKFEQNFTLQYVVCDICNEYFGNNLEIHLGRDTYEGQLRFSHGAKDANEFKPSGRQSRVVLKLAQGPFAGCFVTRRYSQQKNEIEVTPLPQVGFLLSGGRYEYFLLDDIPSLVELQEKGFNGERPRPIRGLVIDPESLARTLGEHGIPFHFAGFEDPPTDRPDTVLCEFEGKIDHVVRRAVAKIAFNYLARWQGPEFLHRPEFDMARQYIRYGALPDYEMMRVDEEAILEGEPLEGPRALGHIITAGWTNVHSVLSQVTLFNWLTYRISLTKEFPYPRPEIRRGHIFDVTSRKIHELGSSIKAPS